MKYSEYTQARTRNLVLLLELGLDAGTHYPKLSNNVAAWRYNEQLDTMRDKIEHLRGKGVRRGKHYSYGR